MSEATKPAFVLGTRVYIIDRAYVFAGEIRVETHFVENGQGIGKTWKLVELLVPVAEEPA